MSQLRFEKREKEVIHVMGVDYSCRFASVGESMAYEASLANQSGAEMVNSIFDFLALLGLPKEASSQLTTDEILSVVKRLTGADKKK
jgi:hypothetical protein